MATHKKQTQQIDNSKTRTGNILHKLSSEEKTSIANGENDIKTGNVLSSRQAAKERKQWL